MSAKLLFLPLLLLPQDTSRERLLGRVVDSAGRPCAGATVVLQASGDALELREADRVRVTAGKRGRFRAELLCGRDYTAWAALAGGRFTRVVRGVRSGKILELAETRAAPLAVNVRFIGIDLWKERGAVRAEVRDPGGRWSVVPLSDGVAQLPALPGQTTTVRLLQEDGTALATSPVGVTRRRRQAVRSRLEKERSMVAGAPAGGLPDVAKEPLPELGTARVVVGPPVVVPVRAVDGVTGKPVVGVRVWLASSGADHARRPERVTGKGGVAEFVLPQPVDGWGRARPSWDLAFRAVGDGYALGESAWSHDDHLGRVPLTRAKIRDGRAPVLDVKLAAGFAVRGRILRAGKPAAASLLCGLPGRVKTDGDGSHTFSRTFALRAPADGFEIAGLASGVSGLRLLLRVPDAVLGKGVTTSRWAELPLPAEPELRARKRIPDFDLDRIAVHDIALCLPDGSPASGATVWVGSAPIDDRLAVRVVADRRGRCRVPVARAEPELAALHEAHYAICKLPARPGKTQLSLAPLASVTGRVVDLEGAPVPGVLVQVFRESWKVNHVMSAHASALSNKMLSGSTDARGRFRLAFVPHEGLSYGLKATGTIGGKFLYTDMLTVGAESITDGVLTFPGTLERK